MRIGIVGAGAMGSGIAQIAAYSGHEVSLYDLTGEQLGRGKSAIERSLKKILSKQDLENPNDLYEKVMSRMDLTTSREVFSDVDVAVEAVFEDFEVKKKVFHWLDKTCPAGAILASNTSSISITGLGACTQRPEAVIGMHFMNPVPIMKLVEIIRGLLTSQETFDRTKELSEQMGKVAVEVNDSPGFVSNRILMPMLNEAFFAVHEGVGTAEAIDTVMKLGMRHPLGPLQLADFIGLDVCLDILNVLFEGFGDPKYRPCVLLQKMVEAGHLGRKTGQGFYSY